MARPSIVPGTSGDISVIEQVLLDSGSWVAVKQPTTGKAADPDKVAAVATAVAAKRPRRWRARVAHRDLDGKLREVTKFASTKGKAETELKAALRDRSAPAISDGLLRASMRFADAGQVWLDQIRRADSGIADSSRKDYIWGWGRYVAPSPFAQFTLAEANAVPRIRLFLQGVADKHGTGAAKSARTLVSNVLTLAVGDGVLEVNVAQQMKPAKRSVAVVKPLSEREKRLLEQGFTAEDMQLDTTRAFSADERAAIVAKVRADAEGSGMVRRADVADLVTFLAAVDPRIDEALRVRWDTVNFASGTVHIPGTKTETSDRTLSVASWAMDALRERHRLEGRPARGYVFHGPHGGLEDKRDQSNAAKALRRALDDVGHPWAVPHTFRRTVATLLDARGVPLPQIADYLGHADPSMTARKYLGRKPKDTTRAAANL